MTWFLIVVRQEVSNFDSLIVVHELELAINRALYEPMPLVTESKVKHVRVLRSASALSTAVAENVKKARRTLYSLMPFG